MRLRFVAGDIFAGGHDAIVVPTNTMGRNGAGLAKIAASRWPQWDRWYRVTCDGAAPGPGEILAYYRYEVDTARDEPLWILAMTTKQHWRNPSRLEWIEDGVELLATWCWRHGPRSVGIPAIGAGLGGLSWDAVSGVITQTLGTRTVAGRHDTEYVVYMPHGAQK